MCASAELILVHLMKPATEMYFLANLRLSAGYLLLALVTLLLNHAKSAAQCQAGEAELTFVFTTDNWGYEVYWELYEEGTGCGVNPIASGGNPDQVGCNGGGMQVASNGNGYPNNATIETDPICVTIGVPLIFHYIDDWGDGGFNVVVYENGNFITAFFGSGEGNQWNYTPGAQATVPNNLPCDATLLEVDGEVVFFTNTDASVFPGEPAPPGGGCQTPGLWCEGNLTNTVWGAFVAPETGVVEVSTCHSGTNFDTQLALWQVADCSDYGTFDLIAANDDIPGGCGPGNGFASRLIASCLEPGALYYVQIDGYNGATGTSGLSVTVIDIEIALSANVNSMPCAIGKGEPGEGSITISIPGYSTNLDVLWSGPDGFEASTTTISNLDAGTYTVTVSTPCDGDLTATYEITMPQPLIPTLSITHPTCPSSLDGSAVLNIFGGTEPFVFEWESENGYNSTVASPNDLAEGQYTVVITDANACSETLHFTLASSGFIAVELGPDLQICNDETAFIFAPPGYLYQWQDGSINQFFIVDGETLGEGTHVFEVFVSNLEGCTGNDQVSVLVETCTSVPTIESDALRIFPNPARDYCEVNLPSPGSLAVYDLRGTLVWRNEQASARHLIDLSAWPAGCYLFMCSDAHYTYTKRVMKH
jgi:hypothetical protein